MLTDRDMYLQVFKSDYYNAVPLSLVQGKCFVMLSRDYFKLKPVGKCELFLNSIQKILFLFF